MEVKLDIKNVKLILIKCTLAVERKPKNTKEME